MNNQNSYYITQSNLKKLAFRSEIIENNLSNLYETIYDRQDLRGYVSKSEAQQLGTLATFLQQSEDQLIQLASRSKSPASSTQSSSLIFVSGPPKYHKDATCDTLTRDFENFEIPEQIRVRGKDAVEAFRNFAKANRKLLNEGKEDVFILRLKRQFNLTSDIGKISFSNSGKTMVQKDDSTIDLGQLVINIRQAVDQMETLRATEEGTKALESYKYAPASKLLRSNDLAPYERQVLEYKRDLLALVTEYVIRKHNINGSVFSQRLLEVYGFTPCGVCCSDDVGFDLS